MGDEFDLLEDVPPFPVYVLPPDVFPGFSAGSFGGSGLGAQGLASVEYLYRPDYDVRGRMLGVSNTRPEDGRELLRQDPLWWAGGKVRIAESFTGGFPLDAGVVTGVGARYLGEARADVEGHSCQLQRWTTLPEHAAEEMLFVLRVRVGDSWVTLWSDRVPIDELEALVPRLRRVNSDLLKRLKLAVADWMRKMEERRQDPGADPH